MDNDPVSILKMYQDDPKLGGIAKHALRFVEGASSTFSQDTEAGRLPRSVVRMYEIRMSFPKFRHDAFTGLEESLKSLRSRDVNVHLSIVETAKGIISLWLADKTNVMVGIIIAKFEV